MLEVEVCNDYQARVLCMGRAPWQLLHVACLGPDACLCCICLTSAIVKFQGLYQSISYNSRAPVSPNTAAGFILRELSYAKVLTHRFLTLSLCHAGE